MLVALLGLLLPASAGADYYRGEDNGIRLRMRVSGGKVVFARVATTLYCTPLANHPEGERHAEPMRFYLGGHPGDATHSLSGAVPIGRRGGFVLRSESPPIDEEGFSELVFGGRVESRSVHGRFRYRARYDEDCRTGGFQAAGDSDRGLETLSFEATRYAHLRSAIATGWLRSPEG